MEAAPPGPGEEELEWAALELGVIGGAVLRFEGGPQQVFKEFDADDDGVLTLHEFEQFLEK